MPVTRKFFVKTVLPGLSMRHVAWNTRTNSQLPDDCKAGQKQPSLWRRWREAKERKCLPASRVLLRCFPIVFIAGLDRAKLKIRRGPANEGNRRNAARAWISPQMTLTPMTLMNGRRAAAVCARTKYHHPVPGVTILYGKAKKPKVYAETSFGLRLGIKEMIMNRILAFLAVVAAFVLAGSCGKVAAAEWPAKPVKIIVAYAAGGANDLLARVFAEELSKAFGQQFFVENRTGGGGLVGDEAVARSEPDGYTLIVSGLPSHVLAPAMNPKNTNFDPVRDFTHIAYLGGPPNVFVVHASSPAHTFKDLLALMRATPGGMEYVSPSIGSVGNMVAEYVAAKERVTLVHVVYRGGGAAILDLVAGHVKLGSMTLATTLPHIRSGALRPLAISSAARVPELPDVPTLAELGYPELIVTTWYALSGPAGMPKAIVDRLNREVNKAMDVRKVREHLEQEMVQTRKMTPEEVTNFMKSEVAKWIPAVKAMNLAVQ